MIYTFFNVSIVYQLKITNIYSVFIIYNVLSKNKRSFLPSRTYSIVEKKLKNVKRQIIFRKWCLKIYVRNCCDSNRIWGIKNGSGWGLFKKLRQEQQWIGLWGGKQMEFSWAKGTKNSVTFSKRLSWYYRMWLQSIYFNSNWRAQSQGTVTLGQSQCRWQDAHPAPGTSKSYNRSHLPIFLMDTPPGIPSLLPYT